MDEILSITYKDKVFTLRELIEDNNVFSNSLPMFQYKHYSQMILMHDAGYIIANEKIEQLNSLMSSARFALIEAHKKLHKSPIEWRSGYIGQIWLRTNYMKNAIVWYNSCLDYVYQIIWFAFDFYNSIETKLDYHKELKNCSGKALSALFKQYSSNENFKILVERIELTRTNVHMRQLNGWANALKHHGSLNFSELKADKYYSMSFSGGLTDEDISGFHLDLDDTCVTVGEAHKMLHGLIEFLINFIDIEKMFDTDAQGNTTIDTKERKEYKKIFLE